MTEIYQIIGERKWEVEAKLGTPDWTHTSLVSHMGVATLLH